MDRRVHPVCCARHVLFSCGRHPQVAGVRRANHRPVLLVYEVLQACVIQARYLQVAAQLMGINASPFSRKYPSESLVRGRKRRKPLTHSDDRKAMDRVLTSLVMARRPIFGACASNDRTIAVKAGVSTVAYGKHAVAIQRLMALFTRACAKDPGRCVLNPPAGL